MQREQIIDTICTSKLLSGLGRWYNPGIVRSRRLCITFENESVMIEIRIRFRGGIRLMLGLAHATVCICKRLL